MASDSVHTAEINLKELTVKTVTLGPQRATVVGEILDVPIKVGFVALSLLLEYTILTT